MFFLEQQALPLMDHDGNPIAAGDFGAMDLEQLACLAAYYILKQDQQSSELEGAQKLVRSSCAALLEHYNKAIFTFPSLNSEKQPCGRHLES